MFFSYSKSNIAFFFSAVNNVNGVIFLNRDAVRNNIVKSSVHTAQGTANMVDVFFADGGVRNIPYSSIIPHLSLIFNVFRLFFLFFYNMAVHVSIAIFGKGFQQQPLGVKHLSVRGFYPPSAKNLARRRFLCYTVRITAKENRYGLGHA